MVNTLVVSEVIAPELQNSLLSKIDNAQKSSSKENLCAAVHGVKAFQNQIAAQRGKKISEKAADLLISYGNNIIAKLLAQLPKGEGC